MRNIQDGRIATVNGRFATFCDLKLKNKKISTGINFYHTEQFWETTATY